MTTRSRFAYWSHVLNLYHCAVPNVTLLCYRCVQNLQLPTSGKILGWAEESACYELWQAESLNPTVLQEGYNKKDNPRKATCLSILWSISVKIWFLATYNVNSITNSLLQNNFSLSYFYGRLTGLQSIFCPSMALQVVINACIVSYFNFLSVGGSLQRLLQISEIHTSTCTVIIFSFNCRI